MFGLQMLRKRQSYLDFAAVNRSDVRGLREESTVASWIRPEELPPFATVQNRFTKNLAVLLISPSPNAGKNTTGRARRFGPSLPARDFATTTWGGGQRPRHSLSPSVSA